MCAQHSGADGERPDMGRTPRILNWDGDPAVRNHVSAVIGSLDMTYRAVTSSRCLTFGSCLALNFF